MKSTVGSRAVLEHESRPVPALVASLAVAMLGLVTPLTAGAMGRAMHSPALLSRSEGPTIGVVQCPVCDPIDTLHVDNFSRPTRIDGPWLPLIPGTELTLQGVANRGGGLLPHTVSFTVTNIIKRLAGIPCVVVFDRDINEGELRESELSFWAQDDDGNVWNIGEYPEEYELGTLIGAENTWIHGVEFAQAGVHIQKRPRVSAAGYREAIAPENDFWDCGLVYAKSRNGGGDGDDDDRGRGADRDKAHRGKDRDRDHDRDHDGARDTSVCVPAGCYKDWVVVEEWAPLDGCDIRQLKTYARGVGIVLVGAIDDPEGETLTLASVRKLSAAELAEVDRLTLEEDARGYSVNEIYATTEPAFIAPPRRGDDDDDDDSARIAAGSGAKILPLHTFMRIGPNPVTNTAQFAYSVTQPGMVELAIYDVAGRRVRSLVKENTPAGTYRIEWDARDDGGQGVSAGVYFARLRTPAQAIGKTIVIAK
jgi:hypothetical protein